MHPVDEPDLLSGRAGARLTVSVLWVSSDGRVPAGLATVAVVRAYLQIFVPSAVKTIAQTTTAYRGGRRSCYQDNWEQVACVGFQSE